MEYSQATQRTIAFIEEQLTEEVTLEHLPHTAGYSKYHLSRIFKQETGLTIGEYIRIRRLALAASYLMYSNASILTIAFTLQFQSQEALHELLKKFTLCRQEVSKNDAIIKHDGGGKISGIK